MAQTVTLEDAIEEAIKLSHLLALARKEVEIGLNFFRDSEVSKYHLAIRSLLIMAQTHIEKMIVDMQAELTH
jgi:hypothetical protein